MNAKLQLIPFFVKGNEVPFLNVRHNYKIADHRTQGQTWSIFSLNSDHRSRLSEALTRILMPLTRLCIRHEVTYSDFMELARTCFVKTAQEHFRLPESGMTNSRIALLTGMSRKHVKHVKEMLASHDDFSAFAVNRAQRVVHGWLSDAEFLDKKKSPLVLPIKHNSAGKEAGSFVALVKRYSGDVSHGSILEELNRAQVTKQPDDNHVALVNHAYIPFKGDSEQIRVIGKSVSDLFNTALHNVESEEKRLQRQVVYSHIDAEIADECQAMIEESAKELIDKLNARLEEARRMTILKENTDLKRVGFGVYIVNEVMEKQSEKPNGH